MALNEERPKWLFPKLSSANELSRISSTNLEEKQFQTTGSMAMRLIKGGFPLGKIFRPNRDFFLSYKHSDGTKQKSFEFEQ